MSSNGRTAIVVTTIFEPQFLGGFLRHIEATGRREGVDIYIIIDRKTPASVAEAALQARKAGFNVFCPELAEQELFLNRLSVPQDFIPYNTDNRRNVGFLMALESGCKVLISIDDDNFCMEGADFIEEHLVVGTPARDPVVRSTNGWYNICQLISGWDGPDIFARGFPYRMQHSAASISEEQSALPIAINAGLWLDEPDVDAIYRLCRRPKVLAFGGKSVVLAPDTWSPINTQNTALTRDAALTYYYVRMGFPLQGLRIDRFGDILSGYLTQKVVKQLGYGVRVGSPILDHRRTPHNLFKDLYHELAGIVLVEDFLPWLVNLRLTGGTSLEVYEALADAIAAKAEQFRGFIWDEGGTRFLTETSQRMRTWIRLVKHFT